MNNKLLVNPALLVGSLLFLASCSASKYAGKETDDVYFSEADRQPEPAPAELSSAPYTNPGNSSNDLQNTYPTQYAESDEKSGGNTYITNNYYGDQYDYSYSARIRRFYHPYGWSYYDPFYTNLYWYDYNPFSWGVSLYLTYSWWSPPVWSAPVYGWAYPAYGCSPWAPYSYYPSCSPYGWNNPYWNGYQNGYYDGLAAGTFNPWYCNTYDPYSYYYGPRPNGTAFSGGPRTGYTAPLIETYGRSLNATTAYSESESPLAQNGLGRSKRSENMLAAPLSNSNPPIPVKGSETTVKNTRNSVKSEQSIPANPKNTGKGNTASPSSPNEIKNENAVRPSETVKPTERKNPAYSPSKDPAGPGRNQSSPTGPVKSNSPSDAVPKTKPSGMENVSPRYDTPRSNTASAPKKDSRANPAYVSPNVVAYTPKDGNRNIQVDKKEGTVKTQSNPGNSGPVRDQRSVYRNEPSKTTQSKKQSSSVIPSRPENSKSNPGTSTQKENAYRSDNPMRSSGGNTSSFQAPRSKGNSPRSSFAPGNRTPGPAPNSGSNGRQAR